MECIYIGVDKRQCLFHQRCEGIYQLTKFLNMKNREANLFSKYVFKRYYYNKLLDWSQDPTIGIVGYSFKNLGKILKVFSKPFIRDKYRLESNLARIEDELAGWKNTKKMVDPLPYFKKCGEAYGLILKKAVLLSKNNSTTCQQMELLGQNIGMIITMRDSIQDLKRDRATGSYNPFLYWKESDIINYYNDQSRVLRKDILLSAQRKNLEKLNIPKTPIKTTLFNGISIFAAAASNPYGICKSQLQPHAILQATNSLLNTSSLED
ncbi:MAG TPA: DUF5685 family protein, partial [Candidatus Bathyarchaeia archaeon]|nr:DUF5685 family protein [Candidatus Bathyarchaeia archaeon]